MKKTPKLLALAALLLVAAAALLAAGCGSSDSDSETTSAAQESEDTTAVASEDSDSDAATTTPAGKASGTLTVDMSDFKFTPDSATTKAGNIEISAPNKGAVTHELVLAKTDLAPSDLPTNSDGTVDEEKLDSPGEIPDVAAGETGTATIDLKPGKYVMFCNLPGHYAQGMYGSLTVK